MAHSEPAYGSYLPVLLLLRLRLIRVLVLVLKLYRTTDKIGNYYY